MQCTKCSGALVRTHRRGPEKLIFAQAYRCKECNHRTRSSYLSTGLFDKYASCPRCGNPVPDRRSRKDKVDSMLHTPLRMLHWMFGGKLYHCVFCRLQFYDARAVKSAKQDSAQTRQAASRASKAKMAS
jgi:DNA-directed RNA polymerase subunit RPC12/RpoP